MLMPAHSLSQTKNSIRRALWNLADPQPSKTEVQLLWTHFQSSCAYCGVVLSKDERKAHLDHLEVGRNHISNRVLSCGICNGDEKREQNWESFLASKCGNDSATLQTRRKNILDWKGQCPQLPEINEKVVAKVEESIARCNGVLEDCFRQLRLLLVEQQRTAR
jgi:hypothetical protein